ncbi:MAG: hypothetical protein JOY52_15560, partial [Hyphomicrobiales bacterium]|nr:hypothetical protein [Hyphomicrobiales bacterium]
MVSITAQAGQDPALGAAPAFSASAARGLIAPTLQLPSDAYDRTSSINLRREARLILGSPEDLAAVDDEIDPKTDLKQGKARFPDINRT